LRAPSLTSIRASRIITEAGGYSLIVSWITIVIWKKKVMVMPMGAPVAKD
jgi:hypothetical protein